MSLNCVEIEEALKTFPRNTLIKKFYQPDRSSIIINVFDGKNDYFILVSVQDGCSRVCLIPKEVSVNRAQMRFSELLNANLQGTKLADVCQFQYSRVVVFRISLYEKTRLLACRLWGSGGNIMLVDESGIINDVLRRMPKRDEWPGESFEIDLFKTGGSDLKYSVRNEFIGKDINSSIYHSYEKIIKDSDLNRKKKQIDLILKNEIENLDRHMKKINEKTSDRLEEEYRKSGELLKANLYKIKKGMTEVEVDDYNTGSPVLILLNRDLNPSENAEKYFTKYKKIKAGRLIWEKEKRSAENKIAFYRDLFEKLNEADNLFDVENIEQKLKAADTRMLKNKSGDESKAPARSFILTSGYRAFVSKSAKDADRMLASVANGNDFWFHVRDYPGCHVVVKHLKNADLPEKVKNEASNLAVFFSKVKNAEYADVHFTLVKHLHKSGNKSGLVFPTQEKNLRVKFDKAVIDGIFNETNQSEK